MDIDVSGCALSGISLVNNSSTAAMADHSESSSVQSARAPFTINYERESLVSTHRWIYKFLGCCQGCEGTRLCIFAACPRGSANHSFTVLYPFIITPVSPRLREDATLFIIVYPIPLGAITLRWSADTRVCGATFTRQRHFSRCLSRANCDLSISIVNVLAGIPDHRRDLGINRS